MHMLKIALLQSTTYPSKQEALEAHILQIHDAAANGAKIIVTQELFLTDYFCDVQDAARFDLADTIPGAVTDQLGKLAGELDIVLVVSLFEHRGPGLYHNTAAIFDAMAV